MLWQKVEAVLLRMIQSQFLRVLILHKLDPQTKSVPVDNGSSINDLLLVAFKLHTNWNQGASSTCNKKKNSNNAITNNNNHWISLAPYFFNSVFQLSGPNYYLHLEDITFGHAPLNQGLQHFLFVQPEEMEAGLWGKSNTHDASWCF